MKIDLGIILEDKSWKNEEFAQKKYINKIAREVLKNFPSLANTKLIELAILLTDNNKMQELNSEFCDKNYPTNVLSFPDTVINTHDLLELSNKKEYIYIGDIAIGYEIVASEAAKYNIAFKDHFTHLIVHGVLHLIGYDHQIENEEKEMTELEIKILKPFGVVPYNQ